MNRNTIPLGRILGIPIGLDLSWFLIFVLVTWTLAVSYFPAEFKGWSSSQYWIVGAITAIIFFVSVVLHELGHSVLALRYKIPVRSITLYVFGGIAQIEAEPPSAIAEFWIAIAGPIVSFVLAGLFRLLEPAVGAMAPVLAIAQYLAYINGMLGLFNLIPGFPLDGGRVFRAIVWAITKNLRRATIIAANVGRAIAFGFIIVGVWQALTGNLGNGLWIAFIGWFLESAATAQLQQQMAQSLLAGHRVSEAMSRDCPVAPANLTLQELVDHHILARGQRCLVLLQNEKTVGLLTLHQIKDVPREDWPTVTAAQVMLNLDQIKHIQPDALLTTALEQMDREGVNQLPVFENGQLQGILSREDLISYLRTLHDLAG
jgi:Zn-dependent protease/CBS domain-containing protein